MPDYLVYGKETIATYHLILEDYLQKFDSPATERLYNLSFRDGGNFNCWRGYQAIYKVENDSLFLVDMINCGELRNGKIDKKQSLDKMREIFKDRLLNGKIYIDWFDGALSFPLTDQVLRWDGVFYKIFEKEKVITVSSGLVIKVEDVNNYVDDPNRVDRRDLNKIVELFFKQLKKVKWKNKEDFDCGEKYIVTIDESGEVSKVRMNYTDQEIEQNYEQDEYNFCIEKVFNALKALKFDVIKDKGEPIADDIQIEIWVDDKGKIKNRNR